jgi:ankyrin repeat protein
MFPNPHDALPLPPRPNLDQYKKLAKDLLKASHSAAPAALHTWAADWVASLARLSSNSAVILSEVAATQLEKFAREKLSETPTLTSAQFVIARAHGFESWPKFAQHLEATALANSAVNHFEQAAAAIITGDKTTLADLLKNYPDLIRSHSTRRHQATLLHYTAANGIEGYRQKTHANIVEMARLLLDSGSEVNAVADLYGGSTTLSLVATSVHPERAGVQNALLQLLLDHGATIDGPNSPTLLINVCLANGRRKAAEFLAERGARIDLEAAAGLGHLDVVKTFFDDPGSGTSTGTDHQKQRALCWACEYGRNVVVEFLLEQGVPVQSQASTGQTPFHWAVIGGQKETIALLLSRGADLEAKNAYGGTALGQACWSAAHTDSPGAYLEIADLLKRHGAKSE